MRSARWPAPPWWASTASGATWAMWRGVWSLALLPMQSISRRRSAWSPPSPRSRASGSRSICPRGPFCAFAHDAVRRLRADGRQARCPEEGPPGRLAASPANDSEPREEFGHSLDVAAAPWLVETAGGDRVLAVGLGGASGSQDGPGPVLDADGQPLVRMGRDLRRARPLGFGSDSARLSGGLGGEHLHIRPDTPLPVVPTQPAVDEPAAALRAPVEPRPRRCGRSRRRWARCCSWGRGRRSRGSLLSSGWSRRRPRSIPPWPLALP